LVAFVGEVGGPHDDVVAQRDWNGFGGVSSLNSGLIFKTVIISTGCSLVVPCPDLTGIHGSGILFDMRAILNIDNYLLRDAVRLTGIKEKNSLVRLRLEALIVKESARRLADMGGTQKQLRGIRRRRPRRVA